MSETDVSIELRRITILERNAEFDAAAKKCFLIHSQTQDTDIALRGFRNLLEQAWRTPNILEMKTRFNDLLNRLQHAQDDLTLTEDQATSLWAMILEIEGWLAEPPNPKKMIKAVELYIKLGGITSALDLVTSLIAFIAPDEQIRWTKEAIQLAGRLPKDDRDAYFLLLVEPLIFYAEGPEQQELLDLVFQRIEILSRSSNRTALQNIALLKGLDMLHPYRIEVDKAQVIRQDNTHELVRSLSNATHNRTTGMILSLLGTSFSRLAEGEKNPDTRQQLFKKARDYFLQSVAILERTPASGELLQAYTLAGEGFLSIAELEQDFELRNTYYRMGREHLQKSQVIGKTTQLYHIRARAAINLGIALERMSWLELDPEKRRETLLAIYQIYLAGRDLAATINHQINLGYATTKASEICGFLSDLESQQSKKREWALKQLDLSQNGLKTLDQTADTRGQVIALSNVAFAYGKLAGLTATHNEKLDFLKNMLHYSEDATVLATKILDPVIVAFAFQQAAEAARSLGVFTTSKALLEKAGKYFSEAVDAWSQTGEPHKQAHALTQQANVMFFQSSQEFTDQNEDQKDLLCQSEELHQKAANLYSRLFFFHDAGENYWRMGQIRLLQGDYFEAQKYFDEVQKSFDHAGQLLPHFAEIYHVFKTLGITLVGIIDGFNIVSRGNYDHAILLFNDLAKGLEIETDRSLRQLRQLIIALILISQFIATKDVQIQQEAQEELQRLVSQLGSDAYEKVLPYSFHKTVEQIHSFLMNPTKAFPPLLFDLPLQEKMVAMTQTRHIVSTAMSLYQSTTVQREVVTEEPSEAIIRNYVQRISTIITNR